MINAVISDLDGLLIDSEPLWRKVEQAVFHPLGVPLTEEMCMQTMGMRVDEVVAHWWPRYRWQGPSQQQVAADIVQGIIHAIRTEGRGQPGVDHFARLLAGLQLPQAIASSSAAAIIDAAVEKLGLADTFPIRCSATNEAYGKPHPAVYITAAGLLGVAPSECVALEDSPAGVLAAKAARMRCIAVPDPHIRHRPEYALADVRLDSLEALTVEALLGSD